MRRFGIVSLLVALLLSSAVQAAPIYKIKDLCALSDYMESVASSINNNGVIVGHHTTCAQPSEAPIPQKPFIIKNGRAKPILLPKGIKSGSAWRINNKDQVILRCREKAYLWQNGKVNKIGVLKGYKWTTAFSINDVGQVVGWCTGGDDESCRPFLWQLGQMTELSVIGEPDARAMGINSSGCIVGSVQERPFVCVWENGKFRLLDLDVECTVEPFDINDKGWIVGMLSTGSFKKVETCIVQDGKVKKLFFPSGYKIGHGVAINNAGVVVGRVNDTKLGKRACVWIDREPIVLPGLGGKESSAWDINDSGVIVGYADDAKGRRHAVMWTPVGK